MLDSHERDLRVLVTVVNAEEEVSLNTHGLLADIKDQAVSQVSLIHLQNACELQFSHRTKTITLSV